VIPFVHTFWSHPAGGNTAVQVKGGGEWGFPDGAFSSPILTLPDWYGPWPAINQAYWRSECASAGSAPATVGLQLVAMGYDISAVQVLMEITATVPPAKVVSQPFNKNATVALSSAWAAAEPSRNDALQIGVRVRSDVPARVYSSRLFISFKP
jgi:hypothetical protein